MMWIQRLQLKSGNPATRRKVIEGLGLEGEVETAIFEMVSACLNDEDALVRAAAAKALGAVQNEGAVEALMSHVRDSRPEVRGAVVASLGQLGDGRAVSIVAAALRDEADIVREKAAVALQRLRWSPANDEERALFDVVLGHAQAAAFKGGAAVNPLVSELAHKTDSARRAAAAALEGVEDAR